MRGRCMSKQSLRFWQYQPTVEHVPMWVAFHCNFNGEAKAPRISVSCPGEEWVLDPGDFVVERPGDAVYVLSEAEFHQMFDVCAEVAR